MNLWFWDDVMPAWREIQPDTTLSGIGTLINRSMLSGRGKTLVCGSGAGYGVLPTKGLENVTFAWVRGPRTAEVLGLDAGIAITDGACLVADLPRFEDRRRVARQRPSLSSDVVLASRTDAIRHCIDCVSKLR